MHTRTAAAAAIALAGLALTTACSSNDSTDKPTATTPAPTTTQPPRTHFAIGQPWEWANDAGASGNSTVIGYKQPVLQSDPPGEDLGVPAGSQWGRLDVKVCQTDGPSIGVSQDPWTLQFADGSQAENTGLNGGDFPKPELPQDGTVEPGGCARGGVMFPVPKGQWPVKAAYQPGSDSEPVYWTIPAR